MPTTTNSKRFFGLLAVTLTATACGMYFCCGNVVAKGKPGGGGGGNSGGGEAGLPTYSVIRLGTLGGTDSAATAINEDGEVVGAANTTNGDTHAFLWDPANGMTDLGTLGGPSSGAADINNHGEVVGSSRTALGDEHAVLWRNGQMIDLGTLGGFTTCACAINDSGAIVGWSENAADGRDHAFVLIPTDIDEDGEPDMWYRDDNDDGINDLMVDLGELPGGPTSLAYDLNDQLDIVGISEDANFQSRPVVWDDLGPLALDSLHSSGFGYAHTINEVGQIGGNTVDAQGNSHIVVWNPNVDGGYDLNDLGKMENNTFLNCQGISNPNAELMVFVVGYSTASKQIKGKFVTEVSPFVWATGAEGLTDLNSLVTNADGFTKLTTAFGLNDSGLIVGKGEFGNADHAFVAVPNP